MAGSGHFRIEASRLVRQCQPVGVRVSSERSFLLGSGTLILVLTLLFALSASSPLGRPSSLDPEERHLNNLH